MDHWEYLSTFCYANIENPGAAESYARVTQGSDPPRYTPEAMMPELNAWGAQGWELVHMQPVAEVGRNGDVRFNGETSSWSNAYFCVFKRRTQ
jgi:hypothetical protein